MIDETARIVHEADIDKVERRILELAMERTGSTNGAIFLRDEQGLLHFDFHVVGGARVSLPGIVLRPRSDGRPNGVALHVAQSGKPYLTNDTAADPHYAGYFLEVGSIAAAPILYQRRPIGVISVSAAERGAYRAEHLAALEELAASSARFLRRAQLYRRSVQSGRRPVLIKGLSPAWLEVESLIERISPTDAPVLVRGESGTGKELVAGAIHFNSRRSALPFVTVNCAAIPETLLESTLFGHRRGAFTGAELDRTGEFERADGGTLFLDELGELTPALQAKLLRAIEQGEIQPLGSSDPPRRVDVRVIAATNRPLEQMRAEGAFRDDLYFRIAVATIRLPPLRDYLENLDVLCRVLLGQANQRHDRQLSGLSPAALDRLRSHDFPGNVRELRNLIERAVLTAPGPRIEPADLGLSGDRPAPAPTRPAATLAELRRAWVAERERPYLVELLREIDGDVPAAARRLGVDRTTLYRLLKKHGIRLRRGVAE